MRERARIFRLPPCPPYDVEGTESWLEEMAARGWLLEKDSVFLGFAGFEKAEPAPVRYRLEAAERNVNDWDDLSGAPDPEAEELNADFGWEYVARRGQFFIYRSLSAESPELHTDPRIQALAVKALEKRRTIRVLNILLVLGVHLFSVLLRKSLLLAAAEAGLPITLFTLLLTLWLLADAARELAHLGRLKKRLAAGEPLRHDADWRKGQSAYFGRRLARLLLFLLWLLLLLRLWAWEAAGTGKTALADYRGALPFADMRDFAAGDFRVTVRHLLRGAVGVARRSPGPGAAADGPGKDGKALAGARGAPGLRPGRGQRLPQRSASPLRSAAAGPQGALGHVLSDRARRGEDAPGGMGGDPGRLHTMTTINGTAG